MNKRSFQFIISFFLLLLVHPHFLWPSNAFSQTDLSHGVQPLVELNEQTIHALLPTNIHPLIFPQEIEQFLQQLEESPPDWDQLRHADMMKQSERLFQFNRERDAIRTGKKASLNRPIAFLWSGILRHYMPEFQGFSMALGPELTHTSWGIIRFKPIDIPDYLIAVPSNNLRTQLLTRQKNGEHIEIVVVCIGTLISEESLMYGFSHDGHHEGMILPVVSVNNLIYILKSS